MRGAPLAAALILALPADAAPGFIPSARQAFSEFVALNAPRPEVPVGALWIDGYGPTGDGAASDNLLTERSLNGMTIDRNLQLSLTAGLFDLIGIEPRLRDHCSARFTDLSIVRVKDITKLSGPPGEPRIVEAIKAGGIQVSSDGEVGLNARTGLTIQQLDGTSSNTRTRTYGIEGRDLFIAIRVATLKIARSDDQTILLKPGGSDLAGRVDDFKILLRRAGCAAGSAGAGCINDATVSVIKLSSWPDPQPAGLVQLNAKSEATLPLPVPVADRHGGLFKLLAIRWIPPCRLLKQADCARNDQLRVHYEGRRLDDLEKPNMVRW